MQFIATFTSSPAKREYTAHLEVKGGGRPICNIAAMLLKVLQIQVQSSVGGKGNLMFFFVFCFFLAS